MNVATALNKRYVTYAGVMLYSLCYNNPEPITVYLLHSELEECDIQKLRDGLQGFSITIIPMKVDVKMFGDRFPTTVQWTVEAYYRLLLVDLLPEDVDRILYLDVDMIINKSLNELYNVDFGEDELIVCQDMCGVRYQDYLNKKQQEMFQPMLKQGYQYFNSGFLLMNINAMRGTYNFDYYLKIAEVWNYEMHAPDQDILNYAHWQHVGYVDWGTFNLFARIAHIHGITYEEVSAQSAIIHYAADKPWTTTDYHYDIEKIWWEYAKMTSFYMELMENFVETSVCDVIVEKRMEKLKSHCKRLIRINEQLLQNPTQN
jgi:lipopolysaccharide biosynthesis glycosyltransferase